MKIVKCKSCVNWILDTTDTTGRFYSVYCDRCRKDRLTKHVFGELKKDVEQITRKDLH